GRLALPGCAPGLVSVRLPGAGAVSSTTSCRGVGVLATAAAGGRLEFSLPSWTLLSALRMVAPAVPPPCPPAAPPWPPVAPGPVTIEAGVSNDAAFARNVAG